jgi:ferritin
MGLKETLETSTKNKLELVPQLKPEVIDILNKQIFNEFQSAQIYFGMSSCTDGRGLSNFGKLFLKYGHEEMTHMKKIHEYLMDKNCKPVIPSLPEVKQEYIDLRDLLTAALKHEIQVTSNWNNIAEIALKSSDHTTYGFAKWFLDEQISEENKFRKLLQYLDQGMPVYYLEDNLERISSE